MPDNSQTTKDLVDKYLKLIADQKTLQSQLDELKKTIGKFSQDNNINQLKSGNTLLKVSQGQRSVFPKVEEAGRNEVMKLMYGSQEWKYSVTFDIVKLGLAYDTNQLSQDLKDKLKPYIKTEPYIRVTASKINYES